MTDVIRTSDESPCGHDTERLRDLGWYHCPNCGVYIGDHRGISRDGQHCTDSDCRCQGYPLVKKPVALTSKERVRALAKQIYLGLDPRYPDRWYDHIISALTPTAPETYKPLRDETPEEQDEDGRR